ncbi:hypothetical protein C8J57DRAFT_1516816 [Mycena rebaudengoi]|nr:hypothetical protein C8J57DRAFT_1516816 [Mycena rebaudengoi]
MPQKPAAHSTLSSPMPPCRHQTHLLPPPPPEPARTPLDAPEPTIARPPPLNTPSSPILHQLLPPLKVHVSACAGLDQWRHYLLIYERYSSEREVRGQEQVTVRNPSLPTFSFPSPPLLFFIPSAPSLCPLPYHPPLTTGITHPHFHLPLISLSPYVLVFREAAAMDFPLKIGTSREVLRALPSLPAQPPPTTSPGSSRLDGGAYGHPPDLDSLLPTHRWRGARCPRLLTI